MQDAEWKKILWRPQALADNHVPSTFLAQLEGLGSDPRYRLRDLISASLPITQHFVLAFLFVSAFQHLLGESTTHLIARDMPVAIVLFVCSWTMGRGLTSARVSRHSFLLLPLLLALLSPTIGTLTSATTSDSIWPLAGFLLFIHIVLAGLPSSTGPPVREPRHAGKLSASTSDSLALQLDERSSLASSLSLTSALSAGVVLSSRLLSVMRVFSLMILSTVLFAGWPSVSQRMTMPKRWGTLIISLSIFVYSSFSRDKADSSSLSFSAPVQVIPSMIIMVTSLLGPFILWRGWRWKTKVGGEWKAAVVKLRQRPPSE